MFDFHKTIPANLAGRDFVVGDIHGCLSLLQVALREVGFDPAKDRLFSVGDLVDRGPDNVGTLRFFLENPWAMAVRGNHEDNMIRYFDGWAMQEKWPYIEMDKAGRRWLGEEIVPQVAQWPLAITVALPQGGCFHVVHAELFAGACDGGDSAHLQTMSDDQVTWAINSPAKCLAYVTGYDDQAGYHDRLLWGRSLIGDFRDRLKTGEIEVEHEPGLSTVYCGHTVCPRIEGISWRYRSHNFIDTGAFMHHRYPDLSDDRREYYGLTLINAMTGESVFVRGDAAA